MAGALDEDFLGPVQAFLVVAMGEHPAGELTLEARIVGRSVQPLLDVFTYLLIPSQAGEDCLLERAFVGFAHAS